MNKLNDILENIGHEPNTLTVKTLETFDIRTIIGYRIDVLIIKSKYDCSRSS